MSLLRGPRCRFSTCCLALAIAMLAAWMAPAAASAQSADLQPQMHDDRIFWLVLVDQLEYAQGTDHDPVAWNAKAWIGGDFNRVWIKSEGGRATNRRGGEFEMQALYSRLVSPFWEAQAGIRVDRKLDADIDTGTGAAADVTRFHLVLGMEGLAPYWFEVEPALFISDAGDVSARIEATYDLLLSQRLVLQPELELNLAVQAVEEWETGSGVVDATIALRLRYEILREIAPYAGVEWTQKFGGTADLARQAGQAVVEWSALGGVRIWF